MTVKIDGQMPADITQSAYHIESHFSPDGYFKSVVKKHMPMGADQIADRARHDNWDVRLSKVETLFCLGEVRLLG